MAFALRLLREPLVHWLVLAIVGLIIWPALQARLNPPQVHLARSQIEVLRETWLRETGRVPEPEQLQALIRQHIDEEILFREALRLGLQHGDPVVRQRMLQNMRFIDPDAPADDERVLESARKLGMVERDLVVRRRLVQRMRHRIEGRVNVDQARVLAHVEANPLLLPARYSYRQYFFSADREGHRDAAVRALSQLHTGTDEVVRDPFLLGETFLSATAADIESQFGAAMAQFIANLEPGRWAGPVDSVYGQHLIYLDAVEPRRPADHATQLTRARAELQRGAEVAALREALARLRGRYKVVVDEELLGVQQ